MPLLEIKRDVPKPREIRMGHAPRVIERADARAFLGWTAETPTVESIATVVPPCDGPCEHLSCEMQRENAPIPAPPLEPRKPTRGRPKKMAKDKDLSHESGGPDVIRKDDAGEQGAIGTHGQNAPAQEKVPEKPAEGNKED